MGEASRSIPEVARRRTVITGATRRSIDYFLKSPLDEKIYHRSHPVICSVERDGRITRGEVREAREMPGWERSRVQIDSGPIDGGPEGDCQGIRDEGDGHEQKKCWICCGKWQPD